MQLWLSLGITMRLEDLAIITIGGFITYSAALQGHYTLKSHRFKWSIILLMTILLGSAISTKIHHYPGQVVKDSILNAIRIILALSTFFITLHFAKKITVLPQLISKTLRWVSFPALLICLLQTVYWDISKSLPLPSFLTTLNHDANQTAGREIFGMYWSDTSAHGWSAILAIIGLYYFAMAKTIKGRRVVYALLSLLCFILLIRISVRASILGYAFACIGTYIIESWKVMNKKRFFMQIAILFIVALPIYLFIINYSGQNYFILRVQDSVPSFKGGQVAIDRGSNIVGRLYFWLFAIGLFQQHPLFGSGFYSYEHLSAASSLFPAQHAHNSYLNILGELGIIGFFAFGWFFFQTIVLLKNAYGSTIQDDHFVVFRNLATSSLLFFLFTALFANPFYDPHQLMIRMIVLGIVFNYIKKPALIYV
ncbi:hypothetical protein GC194_10005 [bacterium]|nr:hypothetical protein [bacterium]